MQELKKQIEALSNRAAALEPAREQRNELLDTIEKYSNDYIDHLPGARAFSSEKADPASFAIGEKTRTLGELLKTYDTEVASKGIRTASEGHLGYIPGGGIYASALADFLADITNEYGGISFASPGAVAMEHALLDWLKSLFGFPQTAVGNLTSGGSIANMIGLTAARDRHGIKGAGIENSVIYISPQVHHSNTKALRIIGLEDVIVRHLKLDENSKIVAGDFEEQIKQDRAAGLNPFLVLASAGTTDTGAVDPLRQIGMIARENDLWYHIDAAYGGFFILTEERKHLFAGIEMADSLVVDPHKGLFLPFGLGAVLVKDKEAVFHSHHHSAGYMQDALEGLDRIDPADVSPELTKHFRALRLWLPLQLHGIAPFVACLQEKLLLTRYFRERLQKEGFKVGPEPDLSVSYFWCPATKMDENEFNRRLLKEVHRDGSVFLSSTTIGEKFVIRMAILSFRTKLQTIDAAVKMLLEARERVLSEIKN